MNNNNIIEGKKGLNFIKSSKYFYMMMALLSAFTLVLGLSYSVFIISTNNNRASEMYIASISYGVEIKNEDNSTYGISGLNVHLNAGEEKNIKITLTSLNEIESMYKLQYKVSGLSVKVKYIEPTLPVGNIGTSDSIYKSVTVNLYLLNEDSINDATITFGVKGGYIHNPSSQIALMEDYKEITDKYKIADLDLAIKIDGDPVVSLPKTGNYKLVSYSCENNSVLEWKQYIKRLWIDGSNFPESCSLNFVSGDTLSRKIMEDNVLKPGTPDFTGIATAADTGLYKALDDYGESYYFRGLKTSLNNNVIFAGYQWKIIRITGEGDVKLIYNGECSIPNCIINSIGAVTQLASVSTFNSSDSDYKYIGYTYDGATPSTINGVLNTWYNSLRSSAKALVADTIYCNDRLKDGTKYGADSRVSNSNPTPALTCPQKEDAYTKSSTVGNALLANPVGLITADEVAMAGAYGGYIYGTNNTTYYLYTNRNYWTLSPRNCTGSECGPRIYYVNSSGGFNTIEVWSVSSLLGVRPVITLKSTAEITEGNGSTSNPYIVYEE